MCGRARPWRQSRAFPTPCTLHWRIWRIGWRATAFPRPGTVLRARLMPQSAQGVLLFAAERVSRVWPLAGGLEAWHATAEGTVSVRMIQVQGSRADRADDPCASWLWCSRARRRACWYVDRCRMVDRQGSVQTRTCPGLERSVVGMASMKSVVRRRRGRAVRKERLLRCVRHRHLNVKRGSGLLHLSLAGRAWS